MQALDPAQAGRGIVGPQVLQIQRLEAGIVRLANHVAQMHKLTAGKQVPVREQALGAEQAGDLEAAAGVEALRLNIAAELVDPPDPHAAGLAVPAEAGRSR